jgi:replicative DNA helicase
MGHISNDTLSDFVFGKVQPQAVPLEEAVLGAVMLDREAFGCVSELLRPQHFYLDAHQHIFKACLDMSNRSVPIDLLTLTEELKRLGTLDAIGGGYYLVELSNRVASAANIEHHARIIAQKHIQRELIRVSTETIKNAYEDTNDVFEMLDSSMGGLMRIMSPFDTVKSMVTVGDAAQNVLKQIDRALSGVGEAITTGLPKLNSLSGGFFPGELTIIAARPGMGKTELAISCAMSAANVGKKAHFVTLEMTAEQLTRRVMSSISGVSTGEIRRASLDDVKIRALQDAAQQLSGKSLNISAHRGKNALWQFVRRSVAKKEMDILFVDYIQLMDDDEQKKNGNREQEVSAISRMLKRISTEFDIPVVILAQLSRQVEGRQDKMPQLSDLRESGSLEQDADNVWFLMRPEAYGIMELNFDYDGVLPQGNYNTAGKMMCYSKKMRSDMQFGLLLGFVGGHIVDESMQFEENLPEPTFNPAAVTRATRMNDEDIPF